MFTLLALIDAGIRRIFVTYDIFCQWILNLQRRLATYLPPLNIDLTLLDSFDGGVPKMHLLGHRGVCQVRFNIALKDGVGLTHGEGVETIWSHSTAVATWSQETGPSARHQVLDDHWGAWNWRKVVNSRTFLFAYASCQLITQTQVSLSARVSKRLGSGARLSERWPIHSMRWFQKPPF